MAVLILTFHLVKTEKWEEEAWFLHLVLCIFFFFLLFDAFHFLCYSLLTLNDQSWCPFYVLESNAESQIMWNVTFEVDCIRIKGSFPSPSNFTFPGVLYIPSSTLCPKFNCICILFFMALSWYHTDKHEPFLLAFI